MLFENQIYGIKHWTMLQNKIIMPTEQQIDYRVVSMLHWGLQTEQGIQSVREIHSQLKCCSKKHNLFNRIFMPVDQNVGFLTLGNDNIIKILFENQIYVFLTSTICNSHVSFLVAPTSS